MSGSVEQKAPKKPDPEMLKNLELLREMDKLEMIRDLHLQDDLVMPTVSSKPQPSAAKTGEK